MNKLLKYNMLLVLGLVIVVLTHQNCSEVKFSTTAEQLSKYVCDEDGNCLLKGEETITAGLDLPPLKMFFVVDNSYTMKANQLNLSSSFAQMFDPSNSANLTPFDSTAFLLNTAQYTYGFGSTPLTQLQNKLLPMPSALSLSYQSLLEQHRPASGLISGSIPGDMIGYSIDVSGTNYTFMPAPVLGRSIDTGTSVLSEAMRKPKGVAANELSKEFQNRLQVINPDLNPDNTSTTRLAPEALDYESGMCAAARILKNTEKYLTTKDQSVFVIVSDEDEADLSGKNCIHSTYKTNESVVDLACREVSTRLSLSEPNCRGRFASGYNVTYKFEENNVLNGIRYRQAISTNYPRTNASYQETRYREKRTRINYYIKNCLIRDGVPTSECTYEPKTADVAGDQSANCLAAALQVSGNKAVSTAPYAPACQFLSTQWFDLARGSVCTVSATCERYGLPMSINNIKGDYTAASACWSYVSGQNNLALSGSASCSAAASAFNDTTTLSCNNIPGCTTNYSSNFTTNSNTLTCPTGNPPRIDSRDITECSQTYGTALRSSTVNINFRANFLLGGQLSNGSACTPELQQEVSGIQSKFRPGIDSCIVNGSNYSNLEQLSLTGGLTCDVAANQMCAQSPDTRRFCLADPSPRVTSRTLTERLNCSSTCAESKTNACSGYAGAAPTSKIVDLMAAQAGMSLNATCSSSEAYANVAGLRTVPAANISDQLCQPIQGRYTYVDPTRTGAPYTTDRPVVEYVSGTQRLSTGEYVPQSDLATYIKTRSNDLFGTGFKPIISMFVRQAADGNGTGGSVGTKYINLATQMEGQNTSAIKGDYGAPLRELSQLIRDRVQRVIALSNIRPEQKVREVQFQKKGTAEWRKLEANEYIVFTNTIRITEALSFSEGDRFHVIYW